MNWQLYHFVAATLLHTGSKLPPFKMFNCEHCLSFNKKMLSKLKENKKDADWLIKSSDQVKMIPNGAFWGKYTTVQT